MRLILGESVSAFPCGSGFGTQEQSFFVSVDLEAQDFARAIECEDTFAELRVARKEIVNDFSPRGEKALNWTLITCQHSANSRANVWPFLLNPKGRRDAFIFRRNHLNAASASITRELPL